MATRTKKAAAAFDWSAYKGGGLYLSADEKAALIEGEVEFQITGVRDDAGNTFNGKPAPRFVVEVVLPNPLSGEDEERLIGFPVGSGVQSRDNQLEGMLDYFQSGGAALDVVLYKGGNAILIRPAGEEA
jgi:hypothetical protein